MDWLHVAAGRRVLRVARRAGQARLIPLLTATTSTSCAPDFSHYPATYTSHNLTWMLSRHGNKQFTDLSPELSDELDWKAATLRTLAHHLDITALAYEPVSGILAVGTFGCSYWRKCRRLSTGCRNEQGVHRPLRRPVSWSGAPTRVAGPAADTKSALCCLVVQAHLCR